VMALAIDSAFSSFPTFRECVADQAVNNRRRIFEGILPSKEPPFSILGLIIVGHPNRPCAILPFDKLRRVDIPTPFFALKNLRPHLINDLTFSLWHFSNSDRRREDDIVAYLGRWRCRFHLTCDVTGRGVGSKGWIGIISLAITSSTTMNHRACQSY